MRPLLGWLSAVVLAWIGCARPDADAPAAAAGLPIITCAEPVPAATSGRCDVEPGRGPAVLLRGTVLGQGVVYRRGAVLYRGDRVTCVGCGCAASPEAHGATRVSCAEAVISPGLINPHDHLSYTEGAPIDHGQTRYDHRHDWRGALPEPENPHGTEPTSAGTRWGELRMVLSGVTAMTGAGHADGLVRNLDHLTARERELGLRTAELASFPLGDMDEQYRPDCAWPYALDEREASAMHAFVSHVAEGVDHYAAEEFRCQSGSAPGGRDFTRANTSHVHAIALGAADYAVMAHERTRLVWSPRSNLSLYGMTAQVDVFDRLGGVVALGTDWTFTGSMNMLRELACADQYNRDHLGGHFSDEALWQMATSNAALATGSQSLLGSLEVGKLADLAVYAGGPAAPHRAVLDADAADVLLVVIGGQPVFGEADVVAGLGHACEALDVCGHPRALCATRELGVTYAALAAEVATGRAAYPASFCGVPDGEPTCVPSRPGELTGRPAPGDADGDGVADAADSCPARFNPVRPADGGRQGDADRDGLGDPCDPSPVGDQAPQDIVTRSP